MKTNELPAEYVLLYLYIFLYMNSGLFDCGILIFENESYILNHDYFILQC